jgi:UDP-N-acetylglucosamine 1-carboxyvinyltransferase
LEKIHIAGGARLTGAVQVSGSKNSALALLAATLLAEGATILDNVPSIGDIHTMTDMLAQLGARVRWLSGHRLEVDASYVNTSETSYDLVRKMRASFGVLGPLLARYGTARVALPGGCDIGARSIDFHVKGLAAMGATFTTEHGFVEGHTDGLHGANILLDYPSVGATNQILTAATLAHGTTTIENAAEEPEIQDLANLLRAMGARITGDGTKRIVIEGVERLHPVKHRVIPDRIETGTFMVAAAITGGDMVIRNAVLEHVKPILLKMLEMGVSVDIDGPPMQVYDREFPEPIPVAAIRVMAPRRVRSADLTVTTHPGFPTDMHPPMAALLSVAQGTAVITETVFEKRFRYAGELQRMGADIRVSGQTAVIVGVEELTGAEVTAPDLRAGASLVLAALAAEGDSEIAGLEHIDRGYENLVQKLQTLGAQVTRCDAESRRGLLSYV